MVKKEKSTFKQIRTGSSQFSDRSKTFYGSMSKSEETERRRQSDISKTDNVCEKLMEASEPHQSIQNRQE